MWDFRPLHDVMIGFSLDFAFAADELGPAFKTTKVLGGLSAWAKHAEFRSVWCGNAPFCKISGDSAADLPGEMPRAYSQNRGIRR
jgi:hypothetical protein